MCFNHDYIVILHTGTSTEGNSTESTSTTHSVTSIVVGMLFVILMVSLLVVFICYCYVKKNTEHTFQQLLLERLN